MEDMNFGFIGAGNIARAMIGGLISHGHPAAQIFAADPSDEQRDLLPRDVQAFTSNIELLEKADIIVLCVKPNLMETVAAEIGPHVHDKLIVSVAAGVTTDAIEGALGRSAAIVRAMPNTPALVQTGMVGLYANAHVHDDQREIARSMTAAVGKTLWFDHESELDAVTAVSGSGPAYFFLVMEAMEKAAAGLGLEAEVARTLVLQTALGAARMAISSDDDAEALRRQVTSPGGTTEAAINTLLEADLVSTFEKAVQAAHQRSKELSGT